MYRNHTIAVVVPAYNEAGLVGDVIRTVPEYVDRVYVVDDGSTDGTWTEITAAATAVNESTDRTVATESADTTVTGLDGRRPGCLRSTVPATDGRRRCRAVVPERTNPDGSTDVVRTGTAPPHARRRTVSRPGLDRRPTVSIVRRRPVYRR